ncbi:putative leucine-rich repeat-containing protein DDB_G0290503 [Embiotoca jacksoni]|uniref:putative leucine-rich repeat-containing protein DDB_G0290503 n=1 Tax=Embiotoca jacksoni TaxID=100190 RepID=UPI003704C0A3
MSYELDLLKKELECSKQSNLTLWGMVEEKRREKHSIQNALENEKSSKIELETTLEMEKTARVALEKELQSEKLSKTVALTQEKSATATLEKALLKEKANNTALRETLKKRKVIISELQAKLAEQHLNSGEGHQKVETIKTGFSSYEKEKKQFRGDLTYCGRNFKEQVAPGDELYEETNKGIQHLQENLLQEKVNNAVHQHSLKNKKIVISDLLAELETVRTELNNCENTKMELKTDLVCCERKLNKQKAAHDELVEEMKQLQENLLEKKTDNEVLRKSLKNRNVTNGELQDKFTEEQLISAELQLKVETLTSELKSCEKAKKLFKRDLAHCEKNLEEQAATNNELAEEKNDEIRQLQENLVKKKADNAGLQKSLTKMKSTISDLKTKLEEEQSTANEVQLKVETLTSEVNSCEKAKKQFKRDLAQHERNLKEQVAANNELAEEKNDEIQHLQENLLKKIANNAALQKSLKKRNITISELQAKLLEEQSTTAEVQLKLETLISELNSYNKTKKELKGDLAHYVRNLKEQVEPSDELAVDKNKEIQHLQENLLNKKADNETLKKTLEESNVTISELQAKLGEEQMNAAQVQLKVETLTSELNSCEKAKTQLKCDLVHCEIKLKEQKAVNNELAEEKNDEIQHLQQNLLKKIADNAALQKSLKKRNITISELQAKFGEEQMNSAQVQLKVETLTSELNSCEKAKTQLKCDLVHCEVKLKEQKAANNELAEEKNDEIQHLQENLLKKIANNAALQKSLKKRNITISELQAKLLEEQSTTAEVQLKLETLISELNSCNKTKKELKGDLARYVRNLKEQVEPSDELTVDKNKEIQHLQENLLNKKADNETLKKTLKESNVTISELQAKLGEEQMNAAQVQLKVETLTSELNSCEKAKTQLKCDLVHCKIKLKEQKAANNELAEEKNDEIQHLQQNLLKKIANNAALQKSLKKRNITISELQAKLLEEQSTTAEVQLKLETLISELNSCNKTKKELKGDLAHYVRNLKEQVEPSDELAVDKNKEIQHLQENLLNKKADNETLKKTLEESNVTISELQAKLGEEQVNSAQVQLKVETPTSELNSCEKAKTQLKCDLVHCEIKLKEQQAANNELAEDKNKEIQQLQKNLLEHEANFEVQKSLDERDVTISEVQAKLREEQSNSAQVQLKMEILTSQFNSCEKGNMQLKRDLGQSERKLEEQKEEIQQLQENLIKVMSDSENLERFLGERDVTISELQAKLTEEQPISAGFILKVQTFELNNFKKANTQLHCDLADCEKKLNKQKVAKKQLVEEQSKEIQLLKVNVLRKSADNKALKKSLERKNFNIPVLRTNSTDEQSNEQEAPSNELSVKKNKEIRQLQPYVVELQGRHLRKNTVEVERRTFKREIQPKDNHQLSSRENVFLFSELLEDKNQTTSQLTYIEGAPSKQQEAGANVLSDPGKESRAQKIPQMKSSVVTKEFVGTKMQENLNKETTQTPLLGYLPPLNKVKRNKGKFVSFNLQKFNQGYSDLIGNTSLKSWDRVNKRLEKLCKVLKKTNTEWNISQLIRLISNSSVQLITNQGQAEPHTLETMSARQMDGAKQTTPALQVGGDITYNRKHREQNRKEELAASAVTPGIGTHP